MPYKCSSTDIEYQQRALLRLDKVVGKMRLEGIPTLSTPFQTIFNVRAKVQATLGFKVPKNVASLIKFFGLSPGTLQLWHDDDYGFMVEARETTGAPPIYHYVGDNVGLAIIKEEITPELHDFLMTPDPYEGE